MTFLISSLTACLFIGEAAARARATKPLSAGGHEEPDVDEAAAALGADAVAAVAMLGGVGWVWERVR